MHVINNRLSSIILVQFEVSPLCRSLQSFTGWEPLLLEPLRDLAAQGENRWRIEPRMLLQLVIGYARLG